MNFITYLYENLSYDDALKVFGFDDGEFTEDQLKKAYRRLAIKYHPDRGIGGSTEKIQKINAARDILLNNDVRKHIRRNFSTRNAGNGGIRIKARKFVLQTIKQYVNTFKPEKFTEYFNDIFNGNFTYKIEYNFIDDYDSLPEIACMIATFKDLDRNVYMQFTVSIPAFDMVNSFCTSSALTSDVTNITYNIYINTDNVERILADDETVGSAAVDDVLTNPKIAFTDDIMQRILSITSETGGGKAKTKPKKSFISLFKNRLDGVTLRNYKGNKCYVVPLANQYELYVIKKSDGKQYYYNIQISGDDYKYNDIVDQQNSIIHKMGLKRMSDLRFPLTIETYDFFDNNLRYLQGATTSESVAFAYVKMLKNAEQFVE